MPRRSRRSSSSRPTVAPDGSPVEGPLRDAAPAVTADVPPATRGRRQRVAAYGLCLSPDDHVLLVRAARTLTVAGQWFLPGGGIQHGEDPVAGLRREFTEETGLEVAVGDLRGVLSDNFTLPDGTDLHTVRIIYAIDDYRGTLRDEVGGSSDVARWVPRNEAMALPLRPFVRDVLVEWC